MRIGIVRCCVLLGGMLLAACNGWPKATDFATAERKPELYPTYAASPAGQAETFAFQNRRWLVQPAAVTLRGVRLQPVGSAGHTSVYAEAGQTAPFSVLFASDPNGNWHRVVPIE